jgi:3-hydroxyacyl-CoA dehydrogenase / enoyl-CoA hydratase / 3-hydroxybutyryl-CoA epimerase
MQSVRVVPEGDWAWVDLDLQGEKVNKWNAKMLAEFRQVIGQLKTSSYKAIVFRSLKSKTYIVGADIDEIRSIREREAFSKAVKFGQDTFNELEDLPMPTFAMVQGPCVGGGCEMVLACDYRMLAEDKSTRIGLPEVNLGIIPGFGGCLRLPRLLGLQASLDIILAGKTVDFKKAKKIGLADKIVHPAIMEAHMRKWVNEVVSSGKGKKVTRAFQPKGAMSIVLESSMGRGIVFKKAREGVLKASKGHYPAPLKALETVQKIYGMGNRDKALEIERESFCDVATTDISKNLIHVYDLTEMVKKQTGGSGPFPEVKRIGVLGAGTMGGGIAYMAAEKGMEVRMKDLQPAAIGKGIKHARDLWEKLVKRRSITSYDLQQRMSLISGGTDYSGFGRMDLVIEAIVEDMEIKKKVILETSKHLHPGAIIATNTSSLSVTEMQKAHPQPELFAGMHFFNPVHKMPLVEVIRGEKTSDSTIAAIFDVSKRMGKMPVVVKDGPGFLVNRLLLPYMAEAAFLLQEGMDIETVDRYYTHDFGMPMGPFALMDEVGLDVCAKVLKIFQKAYPDRVQIADCFFELEKSGRLGKKNQKGFYSYDSKGKSLSVSDGIYSELKLPSPKNPYDSKICVERGIFAMVNECSRAFFDDHIVATAHEVDLAMIMGTGFPPFRGGLLRYADSLGSAYIVERLQSYAAAGESAKRLRPSPVLTEMARSNKKFYG